MRHRLTISVGIGVSIGSPHAGVARPGIESLVAFDGAIKCTVVSKRSSYKALFRVCSWLADSGVLVILLSS